MGVNTCTIEPHKQFQIVNELNNINFTLLDSPESESKIVIKCELFDNTNEQRVYS